MRTHKKARQQHQQQHQEKQEPEQKLEQAQHQLRMKSLTKEWQHKLRQKWDSPPPKSYLSTAKLIFRIVAGASGVSWGAVETDHIDQLTVAGMEHQ